MTYQWWKGIPRPEGHEEAEPREEEHATIDVNEVEERNGPSLLSDGVDLWSLEECSDAEAHGGGCNLSLLVGVADDGVGFWK